MARFLRICLQSLLKLLNTITGIFGVGMIIYSFWMIRVWQKHMDGSISSLPWFICTFLGVGILFCVITCCGHIAAESANGHCLFCYMVFVFLLLMLEAAVTADVFLNKDWEEDFPEDPTGSFDKFKDLIESNLEFCNWTGLLIVSVQTLSILVAMVLRSLGPDQADYYDSDDDYAPPRLPLLRNHVQVHPPPYVVVSPQYPPRNDTWNARVHEKINM